MVLVGFAPTGWGTPAGCGKQTLEHLVIFYKSLPKVKPHLKSRASWCLQPKIMLNDKCTSFLPHRFTSQLSETLKSFLLHWDPARSPAFLVPSAKGREKTNTHIPTYPGSYSQCTTAKTGKC